MPRASVFKILLAGLMGLSLVIFAGCGKTEGESESGLSGSITISGSTSVMPLSEELGQAFMDEYPDVKINVAGGGSSAGIKAAQEGTADIGASSRELTESEQKNLHVYEIARDGIAIVVNPENPVTDLSLSQVAQIFAGEITNWKQVGGPDAPISVVTREDGSGTRDAFEEIVLGEGQRIQATAIIQNSTGAIINTINFDPNAIGYISIGSINDYVKPIKIDGVEPTEENVKTGNYRISRPFLYLTKEEPTGVVKAFIDWVLSPEGQEIVGEEFIPVK